MSGNEFACSLGSSSAKIAWVWTQKTRWKTLANNARRYSSRCVRALQCQLISHICLQIHAMGQTLIKQSWLKWFSKDESSVIAHNMSPLRQTSCIRKWVTGSWHNSDVTWQKSQLSSMCSCRFYWFLWYKGMVCKAYVWLCDTRDNKGLWTTSALQAPTNVMLHVTLIFWLNLQMTQLSLGS